MAEGTVRVLVNPSNLYLFSGSDIRTARLWITTDHGSEDFPPVVSLMDDIESSFMTFEEER